MPPAVNRTIRSQNQLTLPLEDTQIPVQTPAQTPVQVQSAPLQGTTQAVPQNAVNSAIAERPKGSATTAETEGGLKADVQYRIVEADDLITSHIDDKGQFKPNQNYPQNLQPRDRIRDNDDQVRHIANNINPARLADNVMATDGAPIISPDGTVISGNGRTLAVKRAYNIGKAENYRQFLKNNASRFGISPELVDGMNKPVLVRKLTSDIDLEEFARQSNSSSISAMSSTEQAQNDTRYITPAMLQIIDTSKPIDENTDFVGCLQGFQNMAS